MSTKRIKNTLIARVESIYLKYKTAEIKEKVEAIKKLIEQIEVLKNQENNTAEGK